MRIIMMSSSNGRGGREMAVPFLSKELIKKGHEVMVIANINSWIYNECKKLNIPAKFFVISKYFDPGFIFKMRKVLKEFKPDAVHIHFISDIWHIVPLVKLFCKKCKIFLFRHMQSSLMKDYARTQLFKRIDKIIAVSQFIKNDFLSKTSINKEKVKVIYPGVRIDNFEKHDGDKYLRREYNIDDNTELIGLIGRVDRAKGQDKLVFAAEEILKFKNNVKFVIIGQSEVSKKFGVEKHYVDDIKMLVKEHNLEDYFVFTGFCANLQRVAASLDIVVCASKEEAFGLVVVEAMASAKPVVVFDRGALPEIVKNNETGLIVPYSVKGLARGLLDLIKDPSLKSKLGIAGRRLAKEKFNVETTISRIENLG